ncbi:GNAT family N-acetyltransferase [Oceanobacillus jeddahense]|uniref:GNAT family N-acetyltransferase n=1 Tax=Oceanobacillus jeddahense TaxID=1462527 RepID=A0ABY5JWN6_9BACI|nr:GNAT family N-acetyltransferase [Oceanobacillus jeddahense]UUI04746.1 GNAT family N-acetyltransferase [Oceanobacillus jeddahense]
MEIISSKQLSKDRINNFFMKQWGSPEMVISSGIFDCTKLEGFAVLNTEGEIVGYITFIISDSECEIISLDSLEEGKGIGTALVQKVEAVAKAEDCQKVKLITTNDNLHALGFYQKRGYDLTALFKGAVKKAREWKPEIPQTGNEGIPIRDEILLSKRL